MENKKIDSLLGLAAKAGKIVSGEFMTEKAVKSFDAWLVLAAEDSSENTRKKFENMCAFYEVPFAVYGEREQLGHSVGKEFRAVLAVRDAGFAKAIRGYLDPAFAAKQAEKKKHPSDPEHSFRRRNAKERT